MEKGHSGWGHLHLCAVLAALSVAASGEGPAVAPSQGLAPQDVLPLAIHLAPGAPWIRRDWDRCRGRASWRAEGDVAVISADSQAVLYWTIPARSGGCLDPPAGHGWLRQCERPTMEFWQQVRERDRRDGCLADPYEHTTLAWVWRMEGQRAGVAGDDRLVSIGVTLPKRGTQQLRELVYVWSRTDTVGTLTQGEQTIVPMVLKQRYAEFVVRQGTEGGGDWQGVRRSLVADFKRAFPGERLGKVLRVYVKIGDGGGRQQLDAHIANMKLERPPGYSAIED